MFKVLVFAAFVAVARAGIASLAYNQPLAPLAYSQPLAAPLAYGAPIAKIAAPIAKAVVAEEYDPNPQYSFAYDIQDALTGDIKNQQESRNGDFVQGSYSLVEPDGSRRIVEYTADAVNGFNAVVHKEELGAKIAPIAKIATPIAYAAPHVKVAAPLAYAAPIAKIATPFAAPLAYSAPIAKVAAAPLAYSQPLAPANSFSTSIQHN